ncbi:UNVERIFIED_CONTAM: Retrovirus-related Pol polyprotein from type-2 retrotransposable element R2DM [Sesamum radiatum]|uniref:Retrovirus-related Pol polyprotein from type-2 retrotransposable element R2DM n=1 Tax=Sesamum radiatum TaxID=300843 RepID=A0AAW2V226_SESRA
MYEPILTTVVYGANDVSSRRELWQGLTDMAVTVDLPWLVGGDFNAVLDMSDVSGASGDIRVAMTEFNDCILQTGLISLPMQGERFSWHNCSTDGRSLWKRLDLMFVNDVWMEQWPNLFYTCLTPRTSDHSPLVLKGDSRDVQVSMFRFDNYLALSPGFLASVHNVWQHPIIGTPMYSVTRKLKALKPVFRRQRKTKGDLAMNVKLASGFLEVAQQFLQVDRHNTLLLKLENCCRLVYLKAMKLEHVMLRQRAKLQWLKGGDQCSKVFFHRVATRRANKRIFQISDSAGLVQTDPNTICNVFVAYFQGLLGGERMYRVLDLHYLRPWARHILTEGEACALIRPVTMDDVKNAMFDIEEDKAPGPDGFSSGFYKAVWPIVGEEVSKAILDFFTTGRLLKQVNATLLTLIPKVRSPHSADDFRPISCCNVIYKVITKILVCRIREILDLLISPSQNAFVPGRLISDNVLLAQELFSGYNQCRLPPRCALKVDLRKAYDTVEWDFLFATLRMFGFPAVFIRWIEECVTSAHFSVFVNGGVHGFFAGARGLTQGDPISPYIFVLVMEVLQMILQQLIDQDGQFLFHWRCQELKLFQLSFADDLLLLCKADVRSVNLFRRGLDLFASLSDCQPLLLKIDSRIKEWEGVQLSFAGRVHLIKSVLVSLEVYWAMAFILPKGIIKEMIKRLRSFLWKGTSSSGYPKVAWEVVCKPIEEGSQGFKDIFALNRALMSKHLWAVIKQDRTSIWVIELSRSDFGTVRSGRSRKTKERGVGGKCSHLDTHCCLISTSMLGMVIHFRFGMIRGTPWTPHYSIPPGSSADQY